MTSSQISTVAIVAILGIAAIGGGLMYAAHDAEPDDMLYALRASVYGDVSSDSTAQEYLNGAREAYEEAEDLERRGLFTDGERARVTASYTMHMNAVLRHIAEMEASGNGEAAAELRADLRAALRTYDDMFPSIGMSNSSSSTRSDASSSIFIQPSSSVTSA